MLSSRKGAVVLVANQASAVAGVYQAPGPDFEPSSLDPLAFVP